jgi:hypothetical protein
VLRIVRVSSGSRGEEQLMVFKVTSEEQSIACSSPRCVQALLNHGWRLADPAQTEDLRRALEAEESAEAGIISYRRDLR